MDACWRGANYCRLAKFMLKEPLKLSTVKPLVVRHWGTTPGQDFIIVHLNRSSKRRVCACSTSAI
ncbi:MAG: hypothetical protein AB1898_11230 [Acidobacteriota bacterium]